MSIEEAMMLWLGQFGDVWQSPIRLSDRPGGDFITYRLTAVDYPDFDHNLEENIGPGTQQLAVVQYATLTVEVNVYSAKAYNIINKLTASKSHWQTRNTLAGANLAIRSATPGINLTELDVTDYRHRWQSEFTLDYKITTVNESHALNAFIISGEFVQPLGDVIQSEINYSTI